MAMAMTILVLKNNTYPNRRRLLMAEFTLIDLSIDGEVTGQLAKTIEKMTLLE